MSGGATRSQVPAERQRGRPRGSTGSREKFDQRRFEVLQTAARVFNTKGFQLATLEDVADELGVTKPALYYYVRSKDEILFACGQLALEELEAALDRSDKSRSGLDRLKQFFRAYGEMICKDFGRCLVLTSPRDYVQRMRNRTVSGRRAINTMVRAIVTDGIKDGSIKRCDDRLLVFAMFDAFNGLARWFDEKGPTPLKTIIEQYLAMFLDGVRSGSR